MHLHLFPAPWPAVPRGHGHTWTFCLLSLCSCPLKSPVLLQETAHEFPEPTHLPGAATWDREQRSCKPALGHWQTPKTCGLVTFSLNTSVGWDVVGSGGGYSSEPQHTRAGSSSSTSNGAVASNALPWWSRMGHSHPAPALPQEGWVNEQGGSQKAAQIQWRSSYRHQRARGQALVKLNGVTRADVTTDTGTGNCCAARD